MADVAVEKWGKRTLELTYTGAGADWTCSRKIRIKAIFFAATAANDVLQVREDALTGPRMIKVKSISGEAIPSYFFGDYLTRPCIVLTDCTYNTIANVVISIDFDYQIYA